MNRKILFSVSILAMLFFNTYAQVTDPPKTAEVVLPPPSNKNPAPKIKSTIVGTNAFLQGKYIEIGINPYGCLGSTVVPPAGFHATSSDGGGLSMVVDHQKDGWLVGTPPQTGDFFKTGSPFEGFKVEYNGTVYQNNTDGSTYQIVGNNIPTADLPTLKRGEWIGEVAGLFRVKQIFEIDDNQSYILMSVQLTNLASTPAAIYYSKVSDPDQENNLTGSFATNNTIVSQISATSNRCVVKAVGTVYGFYFGYGSSDPRAKVAISDPWSLKPSQYYNGTGGAILTGVLNGDHAISITFYEPSLAPGATTNFLSTSISDANDEALLCNPNGTIAASPSTIYKGSSTNIKVNLSGTSPWNLVINGVNYVATTSPFLLSVSPSTNTYYKLTSISDSCGTTPKNDSTLVTVIPCSTAFNATLTGTQNIIAGDIVNLTASFTGLGPWAFVMNGVNYTANTSPYTIPVTPSVSTTYTISSVNNFCGPGTVSGSAVITVTPGCDPNEPNNTIALATPIPSTTYLSGSLCLNTTSDDDWFKLNINEKIYYIKVRPYSYSVTGKYKLAVTLVGGVLRVETTIVDFNVDTYLFLYDSNGTTSLASDDDSGAGPFSLLNYTVCQPNLTHLTGVLPTNTYNAISTITSGADVSTTTNYNAGNSITLLPGFQAGVNETFKAEIKGCN